TWGLPDPVGECDVEHLDVDLADVASDPLLEDIDQEAPVLRRADRPPRHDLTLLDVERPVAPRLPGNGSVLRRFRDPLDDRDELDEAGATFVAKKAVNLAAAIAVCGVHGCKGIPLDSGVVEEREAMHHLVETAFPSFVHAIGVVELAWPVDRDPDEEVVVLEERGPLFVEECPVRLDRVHRALSGLKAALSELDRAPEEIHTHERRFPALPGDRDFGDTGVGLDQLLDVCLEQLVRHAEATTRIKHLLREEEAIRAVQIADGACRLRQEVESTRLFEHVWVGAHTSPTPVPWPATAGSFSAAPAVASSRRDELWTRGLFSPCPDDVCRCGDSDCHSMP